MSNDSIEVTDLETHIIACSIRYGALECRIDSLENKVNEIILQSAVHNKLIFRTLLINGIGIITTFLVTYFKII